MLLHERGELPDRDLVLDHVGLHGRELLAAGLAEELPHALERPRARVEPALELAAERAHELVAPVAQPRKRVRVLLPLLAVARVAQQLLELRRQGVDEAKFQTTFSSPAVESRLKRADALVAAAKIEGVPALMIDGRYLVSAGGEIKSNEQMLEVASSLIAQRRKTSAAATKKK